VPQRRKDWQKKFLDIGFVEEEARNARAAYIASVNYVDWVVGRILEGLREAGLADRTLVVYTSDHGEMCFDHGLLQKHCGYEPAIYIPFIVAGPGVERIGAYDEGLAELTDLYPTFCEYLGLPVPEGLHGESLLGALSGGAPPRKEVAVCEYFHNGHTSDGKYPERVARSRDWKYIDNVGEMPELYDEVNDPGELDNLADKPEYQDRLEDMRNKLAERMAAW